MKTIAYVRVSTDAQEVTHQRLAVLEFARTDRMVVDTFLEMQASSRHSLKVRQIEVLFDSLERGDTLIVSALSRLGRSVGEIITTVDRLGHHQIRVFALKEGLRLTGAQDLQSRVIVTLFGLFAEIERTLLSLRTKEALAAARAAGKRLGRPPGSLGKSQLDGKEQEIQTLLGLQVSKASIAQITGGRPLNTLPCYAVASPYTEVMKIQMLTTDRCFLLQSCGNPKLANERSAR